MRIVAALYVLAASSPYAVLDGVDCWPERRNALRYAGPHPVVAHPPCGPWSRSVAHMTGKSASQGPWLGPAAVLQVRKWGGILEHPARSMLWETMSLPYPEPYRQRTLSGPERDPWGGWTIEVEQSAWGHKAPKRTWLYMVGVSPEDVRLPPPAGRAPKSEAVRIDKRSPSGQGWRRSLYDLASPEARKRTPLALACWLVDLARTAERQG